MELLMYIMCTTGLMTMINIASHFLINNSTFNMSYISDLAHCIHHKSQNIIPAASFKEHTTSITKELPFEHIPVSATNVRKT